LRGSSFESSYRPATRKPWKRTGSNSMISPLQLISHPIAPVKKRHRDELYPFRAAQGVLPPCLAAITPRELPVLGDPLAGRLRSARPGPPLRDCHSRDCRQRSPRPAAFDGGHVNRDGGTLRCPSRCERDERNVVSTATGDRRPATGDRGAGSCV